MKARQVVLPNQFLEVQYMFRGNRLVLVCWFLGLFFPNTILAGAVEPVDGFLKRIEEILSMPSQRRVEGRDDFIPELQSISKSEGLEAAMILWANGQRLPVELAWWRSPYRSTRMLVVALFYCQYEDRDVDFFPQFAQEALRFDDKERKERLEEIFYIEKNLDEIKKVLRPVRAVEP